MGILHALEFLSASVDWREVATLLIINCWGHPFGSLTHLQNNSWQSKSSWHFLSIFGGGSVWLCRSSHSKDELLVGWTTLLVVSFVCNLWQGIAFSTGLCFQPCWSKNRNAWLSVITSCSIFSASHRCPNPHLHITNLKIAYPLSVVGLIISNQLTQWDTQQHLEQLHHSLKNNPTFPRETRILCHRDSSFPLVLMGLSAEGMVVM